MLKPSKLESFRLLKDSNLEGFRVLFFSDNFLTNFFILFAPPPSQRGPFPSSMHIILLIAIQYSCRASPNPSSKRLAKFN